MSGFFYIKLINLTVFFIIIIFSPLFLRIFKTIYEPYRKFKLELYKLVNYRLLDRIIFIFDILQVVEHENGTRSLKLGDFGLAVEVKDLLYIVCGTPTYVAPEILAETG